MNVKLRNRALQILARYVPFEELRGLDAAQTTIEDREAVLIAYSDGTKARLCLRGNDLEVVSAHVEQMAGDRGFLFRPSWGRRKRIAPSTAYGILRQRRNRRKRTKK